MIPLRGMAQTVVDRKAAVQMPNPRQEREELESMILSPYAARSAESRGREHQEEPCGIRTCFQRDTDRIVHSKSFRRLKHKTQMLLSPAGDHYRTRMTHTLEVSRIARTIARALRLNEDLTEAIALGHDLGHTPFGHAGERALQAIYPGGFKHNAQSLRTVDRLEKEGKGLNLSWEVRNGIRWHTGELWPETLEGKVVRFSDRIAYVNHDTDDAVRAGLLKEDDLPASVREILGDHYSQRIDTVVRDVVISSGEDIRMSPPVEEAMTIFREFLFERVYRNPAAKSEERKVEGMLRALYDHYLSDPSRLPADYRVVAEAEGTERAVCDYIAGMTDQFAVSVFEELYIPAGWNIH